MRQRWDTKQQVPGEIHIIMRIENERKVSAAKFIQCYFFYNREACLVGCVDYLHCFWLID